MERMTKLNDSVSSSTSTSIYGGLPSASNSFPQFKNVMPNDQVAKLLAMHRESTANAGYTTFQPERIYVAVVLAVYVVLLSLLLCRYIKRRPREQILPPPLGIPSIVVPTHQSCLCPCRLPSDCLSKSGGFITSLLHCSFSSHVSRGAPSSLSSDSKEDPEDESKVNQRSRADSHPQHEAGSGSLSLCPESSKGISLTLLKNEDSKIEKDDSV